MSCRAHLVLRADSACFASTSSRGWCHSHPLQCPRQQTSDFVSVSGGHGTRLLVKRHVPLYPAGLRGVDQVNKTLYVNMTLYRVREFKPGVIVCAARARLKAALSVCHLDGQGVVRAKV